MRSAYRLLDAQTRACSGMISRTQCFLPLSHGTDEPAEPLCHCGHAATKIHDHKGQAVYVCCDYNPDRSVCASLSPLGLCRCLSSWAHA